ncbi:hypothetical protein PLICRDRAFT_113737, partial [Plicaturopsis crispa FD-325 SS-3]
MKEKRLGVLAIQEAHLTDEHVSDLHNLFGKRLKILHSADPETQNARGVAVVLNKDITDTANVIQREIIPGRAMLVTIPWHSTLTLTILNIYAPNSTAENKQFWTDLQLKWEAESLAVPDIMLGDFNLVEDAIDRLPCRGDAHAAVDALRQFRESLQLEDGWRSTNPTTKMFSYFQDATGSHSRIDRIYVSPEIKDSGRNWEIEPLGIATDHRMVSVNVIDQKAPFIGRGRWTMPLHLIQDKELTKEIHRLGLILQDRIEHNRYNRTEETNPQTLFKKFKDDVVAATRTRARVAIPKMEQKIKSLRTKLDTLLNDGDVGTDQQLESAALIQ